MLRRTSSAVLGLAVMLSWLAAAQAQHEEQDVKAPDKKAERKPPQKDSKASPELEKAQAEVERLHGQMKKLHEQVRDTAEQLWKAQAEVAKQSGHEGEHHGRLGRGGWGPPPWYFGGAWGRHGFGSWSGGGHGGSKAASPDLEQKVDRLQREVDQLRRDLQEQKMK